MEVLHIIAGPLIGAAIGYCTNWIAVKMLFKPLEPVKILGKTLPFTPGVIPKNKSRIAKACGRAVGDNLLTEEDLRKAFFNENIKNSVSDRIYEQMNDEAFSHLTLNNIGEELVGSEKTDEVKEKVSEYISSRIGHALMEVDFTTIIAKIGSNFIREKINNPMINMFLNDTLIASLAGPAADSIRAYIQGDGMELIKTMSDGEVKNICETEAGDFFSIKDNEDTVKHVVGTVYEKATDKIVPAILQKICISDMVEEKISNMDVKFLEELILSVMKTELDYVVRLGALIGLVIGTINIFL